MVSTKMKAALKTNVPAFKWLMIAGLSLLQLACSSLDPRKVDVDLKETKPYSTITNYTQALHNLGLMTEIYGTPAMKIQCQPVGDNTGSSMATGGEIPRDITEIMKSALNSIGGRTVYIPYDPSFIQNQMVTGYSNFANKVIPDVVLTGGITEFDRGLETRGTNTDASASAEFKGLPSDFPSTNTEIRYSNAEKFGLARITLDFNLLDFQTMTGLSRMNTTNSMEVRKVLADRELGISLFGQSFGGKGSIKKVQGRHAAVRVLVELSMIELVGKHLMLPYWRLLGNDANPDRVVLDSIDNYFYNLTNTGVIASVQEWLYLYGYNVALTGVLDKATVAALKKVYPEYNTKLGAIDLQTFRYVYLNIPIDLAAKRRRMQFDTM
jgi:hypothetical protein